MKSLFILAMVSIAVPAAAQDRSVSTPTTAAAKPPAATPKARKHRHQTVKPKTPMTTATGTTTPKPSAPSGVVPPGAPGTQDPTLPGSPPN